MTPHERRQAIRGPHGPRKPSHRHVLELCVPFDVVFLAVPTLAKATGFTERGIRLILRELVTLGWLVPEREPSAPRIGRDNRPCSSPVHGNSGGRGHSTRYRFAIPEPGTTFRDTSGAGWDPSPGETLNDVPETLNDVPLNPERPSLNPERRSGDREDRELNGRECEGGAPPPPTTPPKAVAAAPPQPAFRPASPAGPLAGDIAAALVAAGAAYHDNPTGWQALMDACGVIQAGEVRRAVVAMTIARDARTGGEIRPPYVYDDHWHQFAAIARRSLTQARKERVA